MEETSVWVKQVVQSVDNNQMDVQNVCHLLQNKEISIETVVRDLCPFLTNIEAKDRSKGVSILSSILQCLPNNYLTQKEVEHLAQFYCDRLKDHYSVVPNVLTGLIAIMNFENLDNNLGLILFQNLVKEISVQQYSVSERFLIYKLLTKLFERCVEELKSIRSDFIYGFIQLIEGERDPRCLILVFRLTQSVVSSLELDPFTEDLFEVISCYFPVLFSPPPNDEYGITKEDLSESLNQCLNSSSAFAEFLFPLILEKLESELMTAKIDSFKLIATICPNYGFDKIKDFINQLWTAIRIETLKPKILANDVTESAFKALTSMSDTIASNQTSFDSFIEIVWKDIENAFNKPELDLLEEAIDIVLSTSSTNIYAFEKLSQKLIPLLLKQLTFCQKESIRISLIISLKKILEFVQKLDEKPKDLVNSDSLFTLLISLAISETESQDLRENVLKCLKELINFMEMDCNHWKEISRLLHSFFNDFFNSEKLLTQTYYLIESIALLNKEFIENLTKDFINTFDNDYSSGVNQNRLNCILKALPYASNDLKSFEMVVMYLVLQIKNNSYQNKSNDEMLSSQLVESLSDAIQKQLNSNSEEKVKTFLFDNFLDPMIQHCIHVSICIDNKSGTSLNMSVIHKLLALIGKTVSKLNLKYGQKLFDKLIEFSTLGAVDQLLPSVPPTCFCTYQMGPQFLVTLNDSQALIVFSLISELISNLKYEIRPKESIELFDKLLEFAINHENQEICRLASKSMGVLVNRFDSNNDVLNERLTQILSFFTKKLSDSEVSDKKQTLIIDVFVWITKGLVISKHSHRNGFIDLLISLCEHQNHVIRTQVSKGFEAIHRSDESCLTEENNAIVTLLYNQRFYFETFEALLTGYLKHKNQNSDKKQTFLTSLLTQLNYITKAVFKTQLKRLVPMLLDAIDGEGVEDNQRAALEAISQIMIDKNHEILNPSLKSFANNCINLSINSPFLRVRRSALNCLALIADTFDESDISYLRETMVRDLRKTLSDKKRVVRKSAVTARCKWILVGQPGK